MPPRDLVAFCRLLVLCSASAAWGQGPVPAERPGPPRLEPPRLEPTPRQPDFVLPDAATLAPGERLSSGLQLTVSRFEITGSTVFADAQLAELAAPFLQRPIGSEELEELRLRLTRLYVNAGYINSGAVIPDQDVRDGVVAIRIVEGELGEVAVGGEHRFDPDWVAAKLKLGAGKPLNISTLQERMQLMLQDPQYQRINAELAPGDRLGVGVLRVAVAEAPRHTLGLSFANNRSPSVGSNRLELLGAVRNLLGRADAWTLRLGKTRGIADYALNAAVPVTIHDTQLTLRHDRNSAAVIEAPFDRLDIDSRSATSEIGLRQPVYRTLQQSLALAATLSLRESETRLGGVPFSFSPGVRNGRSEVSALRLSAEWLDRGRDHVFSARGVVSRGLDAFGSTVNRDGTPDSRFVTGLLQAQWVQRLSEAGAQAILRGDLQSSDKSLLPLEKFAIGGADSVRGFRENQLVRDRGWIGSAELRLPVGRLPLPALSEQPDDGRIHLALFVDAGQAWDRGGRKKFLWGAGPGVRWDVAADASAQLYWAARRKKIEGSNDDLQDRGLHFRFVVQKHF